MVLHRDVGGGTGTFDSPPHGVAKIAGAQKPVRDTMHRPKHVPDVANAALHWLIRQTHAGKVFVARPFQ